MTAECAPDVLHDAHVLLANMRTLLAVRATSVIVPGIPVSRLILAIQALPDGPTIDNPKIWYRTYKEFWLGWLNEYHGPGAYGRTGDPGRRDARFAYNHLVNPDALVWLVGAARAVKTCRKERAPGQRGQVVGLSIKRPRLRL